MREDKEMEQEAKPMLKIYIAHNFEARNWLREHFVPTFMQGFEVTSSWIHNGVHSDGSDRKLSAETDFKDVERADVLLLFFDPWQPPTTRTGRGKWVEFGLALAWGKPVILYSPKQTFDACVFSHLKNVTWISDVENLMRFLETWPTTTT